VLGCVAASVSAHLLVSFALPAMAAVVSPLRPETSELAFFELPPLAPEPEPVIEPEPEPEPEPAPITRRAPEPEPEPQVEPEPEPEPEPQPEAVGTPDAVEEVPDDVPEVAQATVASTEGGLAVGAPAGEGSAGAVHGQRHAGPVGTPPPSAPTIDVRALVNAWKARVRAAFEQESGLAAIARRMRLQGQLTLGITVDAEGRVLAIRIQQSSDQPTLDATVVEHYLRVQEVPPPPPQLGRRRVVVPLRVEVGPRRS